MTWETGNRLGASALIAASAVLALGACGHLAASAAPAPVAAAEPEGQNWSRTEQYRWYRGSQGSRLIPEKWLAALEEPASSTLFMDRAFFDRFGYVFDDQPAPAALGGRRCAAAPGDERWLPIGFARDCQKDENLSVTRLRWFQGQTDREPWIGLNCAACHTTDIVHEGRSIRIDGGATLADFQGFTDTLREALRKTLEDPAKWDRFAARIVAPRRPRETDDSRVQADRSALKQALTALLRHQDDVESYNRTGIVYGHGRLDAVGHILNKVALINEDPAPIRGEPNAPVSYPFIWNTHQHDFVQWNGLVPNKDIRIGRGSIDAGALVRNTSEVIGVFADVKARRLAGQSRLGVLKGYRSSIDVDNLAAMEKQLSTLMSPKWPAAFGTPRPEDVRHGERLFRQSCAGCHVSLKRTDLTTPIVAQMTPIWDPAGVGTDPWMACNTFAYQARAGLLTGTRAQIVAGDPLPATAATAAFLENQAIGSLLAKKGRILVLLLREAIGFPKKVELFEPESAIEPQPPRDQPVLEPQRLANCIAAADSAAPGSKALRTLAYKGRPLNGVWATAPYLHNGSVKSLHEILLPPGQRDDRFWVGNRQFDVVNVGYRDDPRGHGSWVDIRDHGSSNAGHDYGNAGFTAEQRRVLVEYMKTL